MKISDLTELLSSLTFFLLALALLISLFRLPGWIRSLGPKLGALRKLKMGSFEAELDAKEESKQKEALAEAEAQSISTPASASLRATSDEPVIAPTGEAADSDLFARAYSLLRGGKYEEGMVLIRELAAEKLSLEDKEGLIALGQYLAYSGGVSRAFTDLRSGVEMSPQNIKVRGWLVRALRDVGDYREAIRHAEVSLSIAEPAQVPALTITLASILADSGQKDEAIAKLTSALEPASDFAEKAKLYAEIAQLYEAGANFDRLKVMSIYEVAARLNPSDGDLRFKLASKYSEMGLPALSLVHYKSLRLLGEARGWDVGGYLNNAGVAAEKASLPIASIEYYRLAEEEGQTLAMANIASRMLDAGLVREAKDILRKAREFEVVNERVSVIEGRIAEAEQAERSRLQDIEDNSRLLIRWRQEYAQASFGRVDEPSALSGTYKGLQRNLKIVVSREGLVSGSLSVTMWGGEARLTGRLDGKAVRFTWEVPDATNSYFQRQSGSGIFIVKEGGRLVGYSYRGESLDSEKLEDWREWDVRKIEEEV